MYPNPASPLQITELLLISTQIPKQFEVLYLYLHWLPELSAVPKSAAMQSL